MDMRRKVKKIINFVMLCFLFLVDSAFAEIGRSVGEFKQSNFTRAFKFRYRDNYEVGLGLEFSGKTAFIYQSRDNKYTIEFIADENGKNIVSQRLFFSFNPVFILFRSDSFCASGFAQEASGGRIKVGEFLGFIEKVPRGNLGKR